MVGSFNAYLLCSGIVVNGTSGNDRSSWLCKVMVSVVVAHLIRFNIVRKLDMLRQASP